MNPRLYLLEGCSRTMRFLRAAGKEKHGPNAIVRSPSVGTGAASRERDAHSGNSPLRWEPVHLHPPRPGRKRQRTLPRVLPAPASAEGSKGCSEQAGNSSHSPAPEPQLRVSAGSSGEPLSSGCNRVGSPAPSPEVSFDSQAGGRRRELPAGRCPKIPPRLQRVWRA